MAQQSVTGSGQPGLSTVHLKHAMGDMAPSANSHTGPQQHAASKAGQMAAPDYVSALTKPLAPLGASTDGKQKKKKGRQRLR